jgi:hypothetical protein
MLFKISESVKLMQPFIIKLLVGTPTMESTYGDILATPPQLVSSPAALHQKVCKGIKKSRPVDYWQRLSSFIVLFLNFKP